MNDKAQELLMMFIRDGYKSSTGKISKQTAIAMMRYVSTDEGMQAFVNIGDWKGLLNHKSSKED